MVDEFREAIWPGTTGCGGITMTLKEFYSIIYLLAIIVYQGLDSSSCFKEQKKTLKIYDTTILRLYTTGKENIIPRKREKSQISPVINPVHHLERIYKLWHKNLGL